MKQLIIIVIVIVLGALSYPYFKKEFLAMDVSEVVEKNIINGEKVLVTGIVSHNFNILGRGGYELVDKKTRESIYIRKNGPSPIRGTVQTIRLKKVDLVTFNDRKISFYQEYTE